MIWEEQRNLNFYEFSTLCDGNSVMNSTKDSTYSRLLNLGIFICTKFEVTTSIHTFRVITISIKLVCIGG